MSWKISLTVIPGIVNSTNCKNVPLREMALWNDSPGNVKLDTFVPSGENLKPLIRCQFTDNERWGSVSIITDTQRRSSCFQDDNAKKEPGSRSPIPKHPSRREVAGSQGRLPQQKRKFLREEPSQTFILIFSGLNFLPLELSSYKIPAEIYVFIPHLLYLSLDVVQEQTYIMDRWKNAINASCILNEYHEFNFWKCFLIYVPLPVRQFLCLHQIYYARKESGANVVSAKGMTWWRGAHAQPERKGAHRVSSGRLGHFIVSCGWGGSGGKLDLYVIRERSELFFPHLSMVWVNLDSRLDRGKGGKNGVTNGPQQ